MIDYLERLSSDKKYSNFFEIDWSDKRTHENRKLPIVKIGTSPLGDQTRSVWIDAGLKKLSYVPYVSYLSYWSYLSYLSYWSYFS